MTSLFRVVHSIHLFPADPTVISFVPFHSRGCFCRPCPWVAAWSRASCCSASAPSRPSGRRWNTPFCPGISPPLPGSTGTQRKLQLQGPSGQNTRRQVTRLQLWGSRNLAKWLSLWSYCGVKNEFHAVQQSNMWEDLRQLTGVLSSCLCTTAASNRPSYSAWLWSRFLKTFCEDAGKSESFILHCLLQGWGRTCWIRSLVRTWQRQKLLPFLEEIEHTALSHIQTTKPF